MQFVRLVASCECLVEAREAFNKVLAPSAGAWNAIILAHVDLGQRHTAVELCGGLSGISDKHVYLTLLKVCSLTSSLNHGRYIHHQVLESGLEMDVFLGSAIIYMYAKYGRLKESREVFDRLTNRNLVSWNTIITAYAQHGEAFLALNCYQKMQELGLKPDKVTYLGFVKACSKINWIEKSRLLHVEIIEHGLGSDLVVGNTLVDMYAKCGALEESCKVFETLPNRNTVSWNSIISGYAQHSRSHDALKCFERMCVEGIKPSKVTFLGIFKACSNIEALEKGRFMHVQSLEHEIQLDIVVGCTLVDMYAKCGSLGESCKVFDRLQTQNVVLWNAMLGGYAQNGDSISVLDCFEKMQMSGINPNSTTFTNILKACGNLGSILHGRLIHGLVLEYKLELDVVVGCSLIDMYAQSDSLEESHMIFEKLLDQRVMLWAAMIRGYTHQHEDLLALECFADMQERGIKPDKFTLLSILKFCGSKGAIGKGKYIHQQILKEDIELDLIVGSVLVDMYAKCGILVESCKIFDRLLNRDVVAWNAIIAAFVQHGKDNLAMESLKMMLEEGVRPDKFTFSSILKACGTAGAIEQGKFVHKYIVKFGLEFDAILGSTLVGMYAKCGSLDESRNAFDQLPDPNVLSWNTMIAAYAQHGEGLRAIDCFETMQLKGIKPDGVTLLCILVACGRSRLVDKGRWYFEHMEEKYGVLPDTDHYNCMIDLLGRSGFLKEAEDVLKMTGQSNLLGWRSLLSACTLYSNLELGKQCFDRIIHLDPCCAPGYVLMSNVFAEKEMIEGNADLEHSMPSQNPLDNILIRLAKRMDDVSCCNK